MITARHTLLMTLWLAIVLAYAGMTSTASAQVRADFHEDAATLGMFAQDEAKAATITFYSHPFGENFPHAFVIVATGSERYDAFGFTAKVLSPMILMGPVSGKIDIPKTDYITQSKAHFAINVTDRQLKQLYDLRREWSSGPGSRYDLNDKNCVHFIAEAARTLELLTHPESEYLMAPNRFLEEVTRLNDGRVTRLVTEPDGDLTALDAQRTP